MGLELKSLSKIDVLVAMAKQLGIEEANSHGDGLSITLVAAALRRVAASTCPCPRDTVASTAIEAFAGLWDSEAIQARVYDVLDRLIMIGDLLEPGGTASLTSAVADDWLYCAPPTFVVLKEWILILGVEAEDHSTLPVSLRQLVQYRRELRVLPSERIESVRDQLLDAGYLEIPKAIWTRLPETMPANQFLDKVIRRLKEFDGQGKLEGMKILGPSDGLKSAHHWVGPETQSGYFVGRRPQAFGSPLWVFVELDNGQPIRFLDLPWRGAKFRGCDHGWRIKYALDSVSGNPQRYRIKFRDGDLLHYEFFSPMPLWMERRFRMLGEKVMSSGALITYELERQAVNDIDSLLQSYLWFTQVNQGE